MRGRGAGGRILTMRAPAIIRPLMVVFAILVVIAVASSWQSHPDDITPAGSDGLSVEPGVVSLTERPYYVSVTNGVTRYEISAGRVVTFEGNRIEYDGDVRLVLYGEPAPETGIQETTVVRAERLVAIERDVPVEGDAYRSVRLLDDVRVTLTNGAEFSSDVLTYSGGQLSTDKGVRLRAGGLVVESLVLSYDLDTSVGRLRGEHPATQRPQMRGPVKLWSAGGASSASAVIELQGNSHSLVYDLDRSVLTLVDTPEMLLAEATITATEISLGLDEAATSITSMEATGAARAVWLRAGAEGGYVASGGAITVALMQGQPGGLRVHSDEEGTPRPRFDLADAGMLRADSIEVGFGDGEDAGVVARGRAYFFPQSTESGLEHVRADLLTLEAGNLEELLASGNVEIRLLGGSGAVTFSGPEARFVYRDDAIAEGEWPAGISYDGGDRGVKVTAGYGVYEPQGGDWVLSAAAPGISSSASAPEARPTFRSGDFDVDADEIRLLGQGGVDLTGGVRARLRGEVISMVGALFGGAPETEAAADELQVNGSNNRLTFGGNARVWQAGGEQLLRAEEITLTPERNELQATGNAFISLADAPREDRGGDEPRTVLLTGRRLLVEGSPLLLVVIGDALLEMEGEGRNIGGNRLAVQLADDGAWAALEVFENVVLTDPAGTGRGARLEYDAETGLMVIHASDTVQATFVNEQGIDIRDRQGLRLEWDGDDLKVDAMQNGTTQTVRGGL